MRRSYFSRNFQHPRVLGYVLLPWPRKGGLLSFRDLAASEEWPWAQFAMERQVDGGGEVKEPIEMSQHLPRSCKDRGDLGVGAEGAIRGGTSAPSS